jgi:hypothetical protein
MTEVEPEVISLEAAGAEVRLRWDPAGNWALESQPDWDSVEGIRLVSAVFDDGTKLGVAAVRPRSASGHGDDAVAARVLDADGTRTSTTDALVSVEYDSAHRPRRVGIELWPDPDSPPLRVAADRDSEAQQHVAGGREAVPMAFRLHGGAGRGQYETVQPR